eukprot:Hpha_TRINITY_DN15133_c6_g1::TRINITY_DN15133_c6_g1_i1::g.126987::m.126987
MPRRWLREGLWRYSRHPDHLGRILFWIGVAIVAQASQSSLWGRVEAVASAGSEAVFVLFVLLPKDQAAEDLLFSECGAYLQYRYTTAGLLLLPPRPLSGALKHKVVHGLLNTRTRPPSQGRGPHRS